MLYSTTQLEQQYDKLPDDIKEALQSYNVSIAVNKIGKEHGLHIDQIGTLAEETGLVLMGLADPSNFVGTVQRKIDVDKETARAIVADINAEVFQGVKESLKRVHQKRAAERESEGEDKTKGSAGAELPRHENKAWFEAISQAGQFEIEQPERNRGEDPGETSLPEKSLPEDSSKQTPAEDGGVPKKEEILKEIEGAQESVETPSKKDAEEVEEEEQSARAINPEERVETVSGYIDSKKPEESSSKDVSSKEVSPQTTEKTASIKSGGVEEMPEDSRDIAEEKMAPDTISESKEFSYDAKPSEKPKKDMIKKLSQYKSDPYREPIEPSDVQRENDIPSDEPSNEDINASPENAVPDTVEDYVQDDTNKNV